MGLGVTGYSRLFRGPSAWGWRGHLWGDQPICYRIAGIAGSISLGIARRVSGPQEKDLVLNGRVCSAWASSTGRKRESPWCWSPIQELEGAGSGYYFCILNLVQWGHAFMGMGMAAGQGLVPIIRWGLKRLLRVKRKCWIWPHLGQPGWPCRLPAVELESSEALARVLGTCDRAQSLFGPGTWPWPFSSLVEFNEPFSEEGCGRPGRRPHHVIDMVFLRSMWEY